MQENQPIIFNVKIEDLARVLSSYAVRGIDYVNVHFMPGNTIFLRGTDYTPKPEEKADDGTIHFSAEDII